MGLRGTARRVAKVVLADALYRTGMLDRIRRRTMKASAVVLVYHRIVDSPPELLDYSPSGMTVRGDAFDAQMAYLRRHYRLVSLRELVAAVASGAPLEDTLCAVTFDDGWLDNYTHAFPILKKHDVPCTIFLTPNFIERSTWFWEERFEYVLAHVLQRYQDRALSDADSQAMRATLESLNLAAILEMTLPRFRRHLSATVVTLRARPEHERLNLMSKLEDLLRLASLAEPRRFMNWDEVRRMADAGVEFGRTR